MRIQPVQTVLASSRHLLFLDATGALVTCLITGCLFASDWVPTGLPAGILRFLAAIAGVLFLTSLTSFLFAAKPANILRYIAIANAAYCVATLAICAMKMKLLTRWGITYFSLEAALLILLASWEWKVSRMSNAASSEIGRQSEAIEPLDGQNPTTEKQSDETINRARSFGR